MKKAIKIIVLVLVVLLLALISIPFIFKDKILEKVKSEINNNINAKVDFKNFDLTIFSSFPNLTLKLEHLSVVGIKEFDGDTLAGIGTTSCTVDIMSVISGNQIEIRAVDLTDARLQFLVLKDGKANWDIVKSTGDSATPSTTPAQFKVGLKKYAIKNGWIRFN